MSEDVFEWTLARVRRYCEASGQSSIRMMFHGGEPLLVGVTRFEHWLTRCLEELSPLAQVRFALQTNGTRITTEWARLFSRFGVEVGVSIDGPREINDRHRIDRRGRGSYDAVVEGIEALRSENVPLNLLTVIPLGADGRGVFAELLKLRPVTINFLFPDYNYEDIDGVRRAYGPTPVADFLIPVADEWYSSGGAPTDVPLLRNICRLILGGVSRSDMFGNPPLGFVFIEVDGEIEGLDVLRVDGEGLAATGLNVAQHDFFEIQRTGGFHSNVIFGGVPVPTGCTGCPEVGTCAGGYLPHRFSRVRGFDNPSVWCADILALFDYLRTVLGVDQPETELRRRILAELAGSTSWTG